MTNRPSTLWRIALSVLAVFALAACGGDDDSSDNGTADGGDGNGAATEQSVTLLTTEFAFDPDTLTLDAGEAEITVDNSGGVVEHDFTVDELDIQIYAAPTETETTTVTLEAGTYEFYCSIPGHREAGMEGTLTVN